MALRFQKASCVAIGAFNVYIIQPRWLVAKNLIPRGIPLLMESKLDEPGFKFSSDQMKARWSVTPTRIVIETDDADENCGELMAQLLGWLPETPLDAVGNNVHYHSAAQETATGISLPDYPILTPLPDQSVKQRSFHIAVNCGSCLHNLQLSMIDSGIELQTNAHLAVASETPSSTMQEHARLFPQHRKLGADLARHYLKAQFDV